MLTTPFLLRSVQPLWARDVAVKERSCLCSGFVFGAPGMVRLDELLGEVLGIKA